MTEEVAAKAVERRWQKKPRRRGEEGGGGGGEGGGEEGEGEDGGGEGGGGGAAADTCDDERRTDGRWTGAGRRDGPKYWTSVVRPSCAIITQPLILAQVHRSRLFKFFQLLGRLACLRVSAF